MPLPDLIEIVPLAAPVRAEITVPGSKSITNRALILAALAAGETTLRGALWSEDTQVMVDALQVLGFEVRVEPDAEEFCNRTITVRGLSGCIPRGGTPDAPLELFVGNAGTAARFLAALVCLGAGVYRLSGVPRMHERPQAALFQALRELDYRVDARDERLPAVIFANAVSRPWAARKTCRVSIEESSQFASALLLCANAGWWQVEIVGENADESPYVALTTKLISWFPEHGGEFAIEPDASSASYFLAAAQLAPPSCFLGEQRVDLLMQFLEGVGSLKSRPPDKWEDLREAMVAAGQPKAVLAAFDYYDQAPGQSEITLRGMHAVTQSDFQIDARFPNFWPWLPDQVSRQTDLGDSIMTAITLAPLAEKPTQFTHLGRLRVQECERVVALRSELTRCGARVVETGDTLTVYPAPLPGVRFKYRLTQSGAEAIAPDPAASPLHGAEIEPYNDHRMAMCFAVLGLRVPGIKIRNPACVKKTFPNFFQKLAAPPPAGLGAEIRDGRTGRRLAVAELFAE
jgi:3-phosphoshikimate 1-carboxyvinyltransferase